tara:strand:+ start:258 stop:524 length:267 start_codon:yes stop_codon:yes gene_type:complete
MPAEKDITGYGRKMGRDAGLNENGMMMSVHRLEGERMVQGSIAARTINPSNSESNGGQGNIGDYAPTSARGLPYGDGATGNPRANNTS